MVGLKDDLDIGSAKPYVLVLNNIIEEINPKDVSELEPVFSKEAENLAKEGANFLALMRDIASMELVPMSINEPYIPSIRWANGRRSAIPCDLTETDLKILDQVVKYVGFEPLKARIGDLLWICNKKKKIDHASIAIDGYMSSGVDPERWFEGGRWEFERGYRLARLLKQTGRVTTIEKYLLDAITNEAEKFTEICFSLTELADEVGALDGYSAEVAARLEGIGHSLMSSSDYDDAARYFELSSGRYRKALDDSKEIATLVFAAECYESDAEKHFDSGTGRKLISSSLFESAIHAYRKVPVKYRGQYSVEEKIKKLRHKLQEAGENTLHQMGTISTPIDGVDEMVRLARDHVSGKSSEYEALFYLSGIFSFPEFSSLRKEEKERMSKYFFSSFFGAVQYSSDGRVIAKTPAAGLDDEQESFVLAVYDQMIRSFSLEVNLKVSAIIVPALKQVLMEHTFSKKFIFEMCSNSPIVPRPNVHLISHAIWLGLESDFSTAIYLVAPQVESIIRKKLKEKNIHTTHFDKNGIESEYGLSTLLDKEESLDIFSEDQVFVLKALFTSSVGANLRNEVAHGLLTDASAYGPAPIYAWWVLLRMIVDSIINPEK